jgi:hypothetical protein
VATQRVWATPELAVEGLRERDARALLDSALTGPLDARVRAMIIAETRGTRWHCWSCQLRRVPPGSPDDSQPG